MTIFTTYNTAGARVYDVDTMQEHNAVLSVDTDAGEVVCADQPTRLVGDKVARHVIKYRTIYPIYGGEHPPCLFHCYGRIA